MKPVLLWSVASLLAGTVPAVLAQNNPYGNVMDFMQPDPQVWKGTVTISRAGSAEEKTDRSSQGNIDKRYYSRTVTEDLKLDVCGPMSKLYVLHLDHTLSDVTSEGKDKLAAKTVCEPKGRCTPWKCERETKRPGNQRRVRHETRVSLFEGEGPVPIKKGASASLQKKPGGRYAIIAGHNWYSTTLEDSVDRAINACTGKEIVAEQHRRTGSWGQPYDMDSKQDGDVSIVSIVTPPVPYSFSMYAEGTLDAESGNISGEMRKDSQVGMHGYKEQTVFSWALKGHLPCDEVYFDLRFAIAGADAYSNSKIKDFASTVDEYESLITDRISKILTGKPHTPPGPGQSDSEVDNSMSVDPKTCEINKIDEFHKEQIEACQPPFIYQNLLAHEEEHVRQCWDKNHQPPFDASSSTKDGVVARSQGETSAHLLEAENALAWMREKCSGRGYDLDGARKRIDAIKARQAGW